MDEMLKERIKAFIDCKDLNNDEKVDRILLLLASRVKKIDELYNLALASSSSLRTGLKDCKQEFDKYLQYATSLSDRIRSEAQNIKNY